MSARWYKRCGADFIHGTMMLTLEEKGAYSLCLDLIYDRGGPIPDDARWLSGVCGVSLRKWGAIRERLLSLGKIAVADGMLSNSRADFEILSADLSSRERAESGSKGGRKRAENEATAKENSDLAQAELKPIEKIREDTEELEANASCASDDALKPEHLVSVWNEEIAPALGKPMVRLLTPERRVRLKARIAGFTVAEFREVISNIMASPFLRGDTGWHGFSFDWFTKKANFIKILEGNYNG